MSGWEHWVIFSMIMLGMVALIVLIVYIILALSELRKSLKSARVLMQETSTLIRGVDFKMHLFDPLFDNLAGSISKKEGTKEERNCHETISLTADFLCLGLALWKKIKGR